MRSIEHGTYLDDETLALMRKQGTFFVPTLAIMSPLGDSTGTSAGLIVDAQKELKNLAGGSYTVSAQANPDCVWQVVITPA